MTFIFTYSREQSVVIPAVEIDARASNPAIANKTGAVIKAYTDQQVAFVTNGVLFYKIETSEGNLAGYMLINAVNIPVFLQKIVLRPQFLPFQTQLYQNISNFISSNAWQGDLL